MRYSWPELICFTLDLPELRCVTLDLTLHCYKTFRRIPPPSPDDARLILLYKGKRLLYMGREFTPSVTEVFRNHRKFPANSHSPWRVFPVKLVSLALITFSVPGFCLSSIRNFPAIFAMKKGRRRMVGSYSVPLDYYSCPLPLDHGSHVINLN